jgi:hypothetical protein
MPITLECCLLCAATCAYDILANGTFTPCKPHYPAVGWTEPPAAYVAPHASINACLLGLKGMTGTHPADGIILAFRGTLPPTNLDISPQVRDWLQDFEAEPIAPPGRFRPGVMVHEGFWNALDSLWPQIVPALQALRAANPQAKLYITGHSKGGAMAGLAAARLFFEEATSAAGVYIYGPARVGNSVFVSTFPPQIPVVRYEHYLDVVPFLPPNLHHRSVFAPNLPLYEIFSNVTQWDYRPLGTLRYIRQDGSVVGDSAGLSADREMEIVVSAAAGGAADIAKAHGPWSRCTLSDGGYMLGVCPTGVCP